MATARFRSPPAPLRVHPSLKGITKKITEFLTETMPGNWGIFLCPLIWNHCSKAERRISKQGQHQGQILAWRELKPFHWLWLKDAGSHWLQVLPYVFLPGKGLPSILPYAPGSDKVQSVTPIKFFLPRSRDLHLLRVLLDSESESKCCIIRQ